MLKGLANVTWAPAARKDLLGIWHHLTQVASLVIADKVLHEIDRTVDRLRSEPRMRRLRLDIAPNVKGGLRSVLSHPYTIFYRLSGDEDIADIEIVRVLHGRRDFPKPAEGGVLGARCN